MAVTMQPIPVVVKAFAIFSFALAVIGAITFWPPSSPSVVIWLLAWTSICVATATAILRRARSAPALVWILISVAMFSALLALRNGLLRGVGIVIEMVLFALMIWFAIWYRRKRPSGHA